MPNTKRDQTHVTGLGQPAQADEFPSELPNVEQVKPSTDQPADLGPRQAIDELANRPAPELVGN